MPLRIPYICTPCLHRRYTTAVQKRKILLPPRPPPIGLTKLVGSRALIYIHGKDAAKYLQGMTTTNIPTLTRNQGAYSAFLNAQGKILWDIFIYPLNHNPEWRRQISIANYQPPNSPTVKKGPGMGEPAFFIECDGSLTTAVFSHIKRYKLQSKFTMRVVNDEEWELWTLWDDYRELTLHPGEIGCVDTRAPKLGKRVVLKGGTTLGPETGGDIYELRRILNGVAEGQDEIASGSAIPQESNMDYMGGIDFHKGCYIGQELTVRTQHTGVVRKRILPVQFYPAAEPPPEKLEYDPGVPPLVPRLKGGKSVDIYMLDGRGRPVGRLLKSVGNVGLALCRLGFMTDLDLDGTGVREREVPEFKVKIGAEGKEEVRVKAFVPPWHSMRRAMSGGLKSGANAGAAAGRLQSTEI